MTEAEFNALAAQGYNRIPVTLETFSDLDTPLSVYLKLANAPNSYLLESVQGGERFGRYSIIGLAAPTRIEARGNTVLLLTNDRLVERRDNCNPLDFIAEFKARIKVPPRDHLPRFAGGLVGCFGYDTVRYIEPRLAKTSKPDALGTPDILLLLSEEIAIVDNLSGKLTLVVYAEPDVPNAYKRATRRLSELLGKPVVFAHDTVGSAASEAIASLADGDIALLGNVMSRIRRRFAGLATTLMLAARVAADARVTMRQALEVLRSGRIYPVHRRASDRAAGKSGGSFEPVRRLAAAAQIRGQSGHPVYRTGFGPPGRRPVLRLSVRGVLGVPAIHPAERCQLLHIVILSS